MPGEMGTTEAAQGRPSAGRMLREARERAGLRVEEVEARCHVRASFLRAIEEDRYELLPGPVYARGFVKLYAAVVGLDPSQVLDAAGPIARAWPRARPPGMVRRPSAWWTTDPLLESMEPKRRLRSLAAAASVMVLLAVAGGWLLSRTTGAPHRPASGIVPSVLQPVAEEPPAADRPPTPVAIPPEDSLSSSGSASTPAAAASGQRRIELVLSVVERCWIEVYADGQRVESRTVNPGERLSFAAQDGMTVRLGNAEGVRATVNGRPYSVGKGVVTFHLTPGLVAPPPAGRSPSIPPGRSAAQP